MQFVFHVFVDDEKVEKMKKMKNVMKKFYENFTFYEKVPSHLDPFRVFFFYIFTQTPVWCFQLIFIIQYAVRKNIFACLFSVHNTKSLHVMNKYVLLGYVLRDTFHIIY